MSRLLLCLMLALVSASGCDRASAPGDAPASRSTLVISQVRLDRERFDPEKGESVEVRFRLSEPATVVLSIFDGRDRPPRTPAVPWIRGDRAIAWNGRDANGKPLPPEAYSYTLSAKNAQGQAVHDLTDLSGGEPLAAKDVRWDAAEGRIHYYLDKPARVNLRLGLDGGPHMRTVIDWVPRGAGANVETWDGKDASGVLNLAGNPAIVPSVKAYALPENTIFVGGNPDRILFASDVDANAQRGRSGPAPAKQMFNHAQQPLDTRGDLVALLTLAGNARQDADGRWVVSGKIPLRADIEDAQRQLAIERRFEAVFYVDGVFSHENELGYLPLTWTWDSSQVNNGEHFLTLNIRGYEGNFGTASVKVLVDNPQPAADLSASPTTVPTTARSP
jgi:hypothetical protein